MGHNFKDLSILVVEDTDAMRKLIISVLTSLGIKNLTFAKDGAEGFRKFCSNPTDIVLTDWLMKPMSGIDLIREIRTSKASPNKMAPVIIVTGYSAMPRVQEARDMGVTEFLVKPFAAADLAKRLAHVINSPRDFVQTRDFFGPDRRRRVNPDFKGQKKRKSDQGQDSAVWEVQI